MKIARVWFFIIAAASAVMAVVLTFQITRVDGLLGGDMYDPVPLSVSVDSAMDGGAAGFAILSGLALVAASITYLRKEE